MSNALRDRYQALPDDALRRMLCSADFTVEAQDTARGVLEARGNGELPPYQAPIPLKGPDDEAPTASPPASWARRGASLFFVAVGLLLLYHCWFVYNNGRLDWHDACLWAGTGAMSLFVAWRILSRSTSALALELAAQAVSTIGLAETFVERGAEAAWMPTIVASLLLALATVFFVTRRRSREQKTPSGRRDVH